MIATALIVIREILILLTLGVGTGYWLWWAARVRRWQRPVHYLWFGIAGLCVSSLVIQGFLYCDLPVRLTAWPVMAVSALGVVLALRNQAGRLWRSKEVRLYALVFAGSFIGQAPGLFVLGPARYFGSGQYDHGHYIVMAEFLRSERFNTGYEDLGYRPWIHKVLEIKEQRITQCVLLAAVAELERSSAQEAYGSVSLFFVALMGVTTVGWLRGAGVSRSTAGWAGLAAALTPIVTRIHLDAFFSQTATLFVFPALAATLSGAGGLNRSAKLCAAAFLGFFIGSYSEVAIFGVTLTVALVVVRGRPWRGRYFELATILGGALLLNVGYLQRLTQYLLEMTTVALHPDVLDGLFPESGTWVGWGRMFVNLPSVSLAVSAGLIVAALGLWSVVVAKPDDRRRRWLIVLGVALVPLLGLRAVPDFHRYPFGKLTGQFTPIWIGAAAVGLASLVERRRFGREAIWIVGAAATAGIWGTSFAQHGRILHPGGRAAVLSSEDLLSVRREAEAHPERTYVVAERDSLLALWLCYFGRKSPVVLERRALADRLVPTESHAFRRWSPELGPPWWLDLKQHGRIENYESAPRLLVRGAARMEEAGTDKHYVVTDAVEFVFTRPVEGRALRLVWLDFLAVPIQADQPVELSLENYDHSTQKVVVSALSWQRWLVPLPLGESRCRLELRTPSNLATPSGRPGGVVLTLLSVEVSLDPGPNDPVPVGGIGVR